MRVSCVKLCVQVLCITEVTLQNYTLISYLTNVIYKSCVSKLCNHGSLCYIISLISVLKKLYKNCVH